MTLLGLAALLSACGGGGTGSASPTASNRATATLSKAEQFSRCMRDHGVSAFPDPSPSGSFTIDAIANGTGVDPSSPTFQQALTSCQSLEPAGFTGSPRSAAQQSSALEFARCVRANGVTDFPDPGPGDPLIDTNRIPSSATADGRAILRSATEKCADLARAAGATGAR